MNQIFLKDHKKIALFYKGQSISYHQLREQVRCFSSHLNLSPGDHVAIFAENNPDWIYGLYAIWHKGGVAIPYDFSAPEDELIYMLKDSKPRVILTSKEGKIKLEKYKIQSNIPDQVLIMENLTEGGPFPSKMEQREPEDTALILYTSGTTGNPKGVMLSFTSILFNIKAVIESNMLHPDDRLMALFPFHHIVPLQGHILCPLYIGSTVAFVETLSAEAIMDTFQKYKITVINGVPRLYERFHQTIFRKIKANPIGRILLGLARLINNQPFRRRLFSRVHRAFGGHIRYLLSGGAPLDKKIADDFWTLGFHMIEGYGLTEMGPLISYNTPDAWKTGTVGKPVKGVDVRIENGEVMATSPGIMKGYLNNKKETRKIMVNGWIKTGDLGFFDNEGFLVLNGRKNDMIALPSGKNIYAEEIENHLLSSNPLLEEVAVIQRNGKLFAIIHPNFNVLRERGIKNIREAVKWEVLDDYNHKAPMHKKILDYSVIKDSFPRTRLGKIKRHRLAELLQPSIKDLPQHGSPESEEYRVIKTYLEKESGQRVNPNSHLEIDLGLDSLALIDLKIYLENTFGYSTPETVFIDHPTVDSLTTYIQNNKTKIETTSSGLSLLLKNTKIDTIKKNKFAFYLLWILFYPILSLFYRVKKQGVSHIRQMMHQGRNFILAPNHQSFLDALLLSSTLPVNILKNTYFLAKAKHFQFPLGHFFKNNLNTILMDINQESEKIIRKIISILKQGKNVVIFPEGTRSYTGKLGRFSKTFAILSKELKVPVFPVGIKGTYDLLPRNKNIPKPGIVNIKFFPFVDPVANDAGAINKNVFNTLKEFVEA